MDLSQPSTQWFRIRINWGSILAAAVFWTYGYYAALSRVSSSPVVQWTMTGGFAGLFVALLWCSRREEARDAISIRKADVTALATYAAILIPLSWSALNAPLSSDQIYYSSASHFHAIASLWLIRGWSPSFIGDAPFALLAQGLDIAALLGTLAIIVVSKRARWKIPLFALAFIGIRVAMLQVRPPDLHPPVGLLPLWFSSSILSWTPFAFRLPQFLALLVVMCFVRRRVSAELSFAPSLLVGLAVGTIPVLWHVSALVEQSVWTFAAWTMLLFTFALRRPEEPVNWVRWVSLVSLCALMRVGAFIAFGFLLLAWWHYERDRKISVGEFVRSMVPAFLRRPLIVYGLLAMLPFLAKSLILGTPSTRFTSQPAGRLAAILPPNATALERVVSSLTSGISAEIVWRSVLPFWVIMAACAFLPRRRPGRRMAVYVLAFFAAAYCMFYAIRSDLWGSGKYQIEYVAPFAALGFASLILLTHRMVGRAVVVAACIAAFAYNASVYFRLHELNAPAVEQDINPERNLTTVILAERAYDYDRALRAARSAGHGDHTVLVGHTYGAFSYMLAGFDYEEVLKAIVREGAHASWRWQKKAEQIHSDGRINLVLLSDVPTRDVENDLLKLGWIPWRSFYNEQYGSRIVGLTRPKR